MQIKRHNHSNCYKKLGQVTDQKNVMKNIILVSILSAALIGCGTNVTKEVISNSSEDTFTNPLLERGADPWIFYHESFYYYTNTMSKQIGIWRTRDITELRGAEYKTIYVPPENTMYSKQLWAPEIMNINDNWYVYFAADDGDNLNHKLYVLENTSDDPFEGEFKMK